MILAMALLVNGVHKAIVLWNYWGMDWNLFWSESAMFGGTFGMSTVQWFLGLSWLGCFTGWAMF